MFKERCLILALALLALALPAPAQFEGPAPLSWRWVQPTKVSPSGSPVVLGNNVYVGVGQRIYAVDKETGNKKWQFPLVEPINGYFSSGLITDGKLLIAAADNRNIYGVDPTTGELKWQHQALVGIIGRPVICGKWVVYAMADNSLNAIDAATGELAWDMPIKVYDGITGRLAAYGGQVLYFTNNFDLRAFDVTTKKTKWTQKFTVIMPDAIPIVYGETVYVSTGQYISAVNAVSGRGGKNAPIGEEIAFGPAVSGEGVMVVTRNGKAIFLDSNLRPTKKTHDLGSYPVVQPSAIGRFFVAPTTNGALNVIDPKTGDIVWSYVIRPMAGTAAASDANVRPGANNTPRSLISIQASGPATLEGKTLLILARDGSLLAFDRDTGVDLTPPSVKMVWPNAGDYVNGQTLELMFKIDDEATGVNENAINITANGKALDFEFTRDGFAIARISPLSKNKPLANGRQTLLVTVADWMGNSSTSTFSLMVDNTLAPLGRPGSVEGPGDNKPGGVVGPGKGGKGGSGG